MSIECTTSEKERKEEVKSPLKHECHNTSKPIKNGNHVQKGSPQTKKKRHIEDRSNVLLLGMSYPSIRTHMQAENYSEELIRTLLDESDHSSPTDLVVELVRRNILTEMDGRDLARILTVEEHYNCYTVSQEKGAKYHPDRHLQANFNRSSSFLRGMQQTFGESVAFRQIILDYFWIPKGTWTMVHWSRSFFRETLPKLAALLEYPNGVIYLPFCLHCMRELVANMDVLKSYYEISFIYQEDLSEHSLWSGTQTIDATTMQEWLGKKLAQEEQYCTFLPKDVYQNMECGNVSTNDVVSVLRLIENFASVRMIKLRPLPQHNPARKKLRSRAKPKVNRKARKCNKKVQPVLKLGGFLGLAKSPSLVQNGFDSLASTGADKGDDSGTDTTAEESDSVSTESEVEKPSLKKKSPPKRKARRKRQEDSPPSKKRRLYRIVPDLDTYLNLGEEGHEKLTYHYQIKDNATNVLDGCEALGGPERSESGRDEHLGWSNHQDFNAAQAILRLNEGWPSESIKLAQVRRRKTSMQHTPNNSSALNIPQDMREDPQDILSHYLYILLGQLKFCDLRESDQCGPYKHYPAGTQGFACVHCNGKPGDGRYFLPEEDRDQFPLYSKSFPLIHQHLIRCKGCPVATRQKLTQLHDACKKRRDPTARINLNAKWLGRFQRFHRRWKIRVKMHQSQRSDDAESSVLVKCSSLAIPSAPNACSLMALGDGTRKVVASTNTAKKRPNPRAKQITPNATELSAFAAKFNGRAADVATPGGVSMMNNNVSSPHMNSLVLGGVNPQIERTASRKQLILRAVQSIPTSTELPLFAVNCNPTMADCIPAARLSTNYVAHGSFSSPRIDTLMDLGGVVRRSNAMATQITPQYSQPPLDVSLFPRHTRTFGDRV